MLRTFQAFLVVLGDGFSHRVGDIGRHALDLLPAKSFDDCHGQAGRTRRLGVLLFGRTSFPAQNADGGSHLIHYQLSTHFRLAP